MIDFIGPQGEVPTSCRVDSMRTPTSIHTRTAPDASGSRPMSEVVCLHASRICNCNLHCLYIRKKVLYFLAINVFKPIERIRFIAKV